MQAWEHFDGETRMRIGQVNVHGYQYGGGRRDLLRASTEQHILWNSEYGDDQASGKDMAVNLQHDFRWLRHNAWCYWQPFDIEGWGLIASIPGDAWIGEANTKYFVLAHYTRHIKPGMLILKTDSKDCVCAWDARSTRLVIVFVNTGSQRSVACDLSLLPAGENSVMAWQTEFDGKIKYCEIDEVTVTESSLECNLPGNSITTFEIARPITD